MAAILSRRDELKAILYSPVWYDCLPDSSPGLIYWSLNKYGVCTEISTWMFMISEMTLAYFTKKVKLESWLSLAETPSNLNGSLVELMLSSLVK